MEDVTEEEKETSTVKICPLPWSERYLPPPPPVARFPRTIS